MKPTTLWVVAAVLGLAQSASPGALTFTVGQSGTLAGANNWPSADPPSFLVDGNGATKYVNFAKLNAGYVVTPASGPSVVTGLALTTANNAPEQDPTSYLLYGSNSVTANSSPGSVFNVDGNFTLVSSGSLSPPSARGTAYSPAVAFANSTAYQTYLLVFPTVSNPATATAMQLAEAELTGASGNITSSNDALGGGQLAPEPSPATALLLGLSAGALFARFRRAPRRASVGAAAGRPG